LDFGQKNIELLIRWTKIGRTALVK